MHKVAGVLASGASGYPAVELDYANGQNVNFSDVSAQSAIINSVLIRLYGSDDFYYAVGDNPTAVATGASAYLAGGVVEFVALRYGQRIAVLRATTNNGTVNIVPAVLRS